MVFKIVDMGGNCLVFFTIVSLAPISVPDSQQELNPYLLNDQMEKRQRAIAVIQA